MDGRNEIIDNLYTYGMILVVLGHIGLSPEFNYSYLHQWIYAFHMPLFFFIAGYLFRIIHGSEIKFIIKKTKRLIIPLVVLTTIVFFPKVLLSEYALRPQEGGFTNLIFAIIIPKRNPIQPLWFLNVLFGVYLIAIPLYNYLKSNIIGWITVGCIAAFLAFFFRNVEWLGFSQILYYFPFFCFGQICKYIHLLDHRKYSYSFWIIIVFFIMLSLGVYYSLNRYIIAFIGLISSITFIGYITQLKIPFFPSLRQYTFSIYLLQWFPMVFIRTILYNYLHWNYILCYILMFSFGIIVPIMFVKLVESIINPQNKAGKWVYLSLGM